jgi:hypothetical protein
LAFDNTGQYLAFGTNTGAVCVVHSERLHVAPECAVWDAVGDENATITSVVFSPDGKQLAVRGTNGVVAAFKFSKNAMNVVTLVKVRVIEGIETNYEMSNVAWSSDSKLLAVGTSVRPKSGEMSFLKFYKSSSKEGGGEAVASIAIEEGVSVVCVQWPTKLNQIFLGLSTGECRAFYDEEMSKKGVTLSARRKPRAANPLDVLLSERMGENSEIITPFAPNQGGGGGDGKLTKKQREKEKQSMAPEKSSSVPVHRNAASISMTQNMCDNLGISGKSKDLLERDPRTALLKYANYNPTGVKTGLGSVYDKQPVLLADSTAEEEQEKKRQRTG